MNGTAGPVVLSHSRCGQIMSKACWRSQAHGKFPLTLFLRKLHNCLKSISNYSRYPPFKIIWPSQSGSNKSKAEVKCSMEERPLDSKTRGPASIVSCFVTLYQLSIATVMVHNKPPPSVAYNNKHWFRLGSLCRSAEQLWAYSELGLHGLARVSVVSRGLVRCLCCS